MNLRMKKSENASGGAGGARHSTDSPRVVVRVDSPSRLRQLEEDRPGSTVNSAEGTRFAYAGASKQD